MAEAERFILKNGNFETMYIVGEGILHHISDYLKDYQKSIIMVSSKIEEKYSKFLPDFEKTGKGIIKFIVSDGENLKNIKNYQKIMTIMLENEIEKNSILGYVGGGTVGDMAGFVAATYKRGMNLMAIPTTFLSQVDSSIGGKNGINYGGVKNIIGTFYSPSVIISDTYFITASDDSVLREGLCEVLKYAIIADASLFSALSKFNELSELKNRTSLMMIISKSARAKNDIISKDYYDQLGIRVKLNFGHTIGHAIEAASKSAISHGRAITTGMLIESMLSRKLGIAEDDFYSIIREAMNKFGIKIVNTRTYGVETLMKFIRNDKKISGNAILLPLPKRIGETSMVSVTFEQISDTIKEFNERTWNP
ncbi:MAG: 3-dehydroquinate synthase [Thermoplasmataceae archaeon]